MTQKISSVNIESATLASFSGPTIANVSIANSTYTILDDTAVSNAGGYVVITGSNFQSGAQVLFGSTSACTVTFVDSTQLNVQVPALTAGSYVVYVQNGDGSTAIKLNGITSSPTPVWGTDSTLTQQDAGFAFSISLAASSDSNVTFTLSSGSTLPPGTTLTSNGVFSGTITIESGETTYNFSVDAIDAENQETLRSFSVTVVTGDANYKDTVLHLNGETSNNTWITDVSSNAFAIAVTGDTRPTAFSPYETVWSNFFDGTGDYLTIADAEQFEMSGDFTVEAWFHMTATPGTFGNIISKGASGVFQPYYIFVNSSNNLLFYSSSDGTSWDVANGVSLGTVSTNVWYHVAVSRQSSSIRLFLNGNLITTINNSNALFNNTRAVAVGARSDGTELFTGYISNVRILQGLGLYTSSFTPSTTPLTAINNTVLLTCNSNRLIDRSNNAFTVSKSGDVFVSSFGPFAETDITTGSGYFDGAGDYLTITNFTSGSNNAFAMGTGDFTVEWWMYCPSYPTSDIIAIAPNGWSIVIFSGDLYFQAGRGSGSFNNFFTISTHVPVNTWGHFAYVRSGSFARFYANGVPVGNGVADTTNFTVSSTDSILIGGGASPAYGSFTGRISNMRVTKGVAVYTGRFTPPNQPLTIAGSSAIYANTSNVNTSYSSSNTSLLTLQSRIGENNNRFVDTSGFNNIITRSGNATQGTFSPFAVTGWSNYFDGSTDFLTVPSSASANLDFGGVSDWCVEFWYYPLSIPTDTTGIIQAVQGGSNWRTNFGVFQTSENKISLVTAQAAGTISTETFNLNQWNHVAVVQTNSNSQKVYLNGVATSIERYFAITSINTSFYIGKSDNTAGNIDYIDGYVSNLRYVRGSTPYVSNFTPPASPLTAIANTVLLTCQSNRFVDNSTNNFAITRNGDVSVQPFSPFTPTNSWSPTTVGGSMLFDGTGDFLTVPNNAVLNPETQDFVMEAWVYIRALTGANQGLNGKGTAGTDGYSFFITNALVLSFIWNGTGGATITAGTLKLNAWHHVAVVRNDGVIRLYLDGVGAESSTVCTTNITTTGVKYVGQARGTNPVNGYMSGYRMIKGELPTGYDATASTITVPTAPFETFKSTSLLLNGTNGGIIDYTGRNNLETVGDARLRNNITKYGNTSLFFDGTGDYLLAPSDPSFDFGTGDFTIEMWVNFTNATSAWQAIISRAYGVAGGWRLYKHNNDNQLRWYHNTTSILLTTGSDIASGVWSHIAVVRNGTTLTIYINGTNRGSVTNTTSYNPGNYAVEIGSGVVTSTFPMTGYIDELRITKGVARYTANFTPPISSFKIK